MELLVLQMAKLEGVTEALKAANQMDWVRRMNNTAAGRKRSFRTSSFTAEGVPRC